MGSICPKDLTACPDDLCRGGGTCLQTGDELWERCDVCGKVYSREWDIECACQPNDEDDDG